MDKTFVLGVGGAKCGTTWLYHYLSALEGADLGMRKEYNALLNIFGQTDSTWITRRSRVKTALAQKTASRRSQVERLQSSLCNYVDYFDGLLCNGASLTADISPAYVRLSADHLSEVIAAFHERGITVRVVLLLRNPVERLISHAKMIERWRTISSFASVRDGAGLGEILHLVARDPVLNFSYRRAVETVLRATGAEGRFISPMETLMTPEGITRLSASLRTRENTDFMNVIVNKGRRVAQDQTIADARPFLRDATQDNRLFGISYFDDPRVTSAWA